MPTLSGQRNSIKLQKIYLNLFLASLLLLILKNHQIRNPRLLNKEVNEIMQTNSLNTKISGIASKLIDKLMVASGVIALVWIFAFLLVALMDK